MQKLNAVILLEESWFQVICSCSFVIFSTQYCCFNLLIGYISTFSSLASTGFWWVRGMSNCEGGCPTAEGSSKNKVLKYSPQQFTTSSGCLTSLPQESITEAGSLDLARTPRLLKYLHASSQGTSFKARWYSYLSKLIIANFAPLCST